MSSLSISFIEQPTEFHRFRYETEVQGGKLGGLLYGRHGGKSCPRLRISGIEPLLHKVVIVIGGTVNPDGFPHPFFMVGDNCSDGAFQLRKEVATLGDKRELEICLEKVSIICVSTKGEKLTEAINNRKRINFNPCNKDVDSIKYTPRNLKSVRLVFQVYYQDFDNQTVATPAIVVSDVITDAKKEVKLGIYGVHPNTISVSGSQDLWIYFDDPLPHTDRGSFSVEVQAELHGNFSCKVKEARKHLLIVTKPDVAQIMAGCDERTKCSLVVKDLKAAVSESNDIILLGPVFDSSGLQALLSGMAEPKRKRARPQDADVPEINVFDLMSS